MTEILSSPSSQPSPQPPRPSQSPPTWIYAALVALYFAVEIEVLVALASMVSRVVDVADVRQRLHMVATLEAKISWSIQNLQRQTADLAPQVVSDAVNWGDQTAHHRVRQVLGDRRPVGYMPDTTIVDRAARDLLERLRIMQTAVKPIIVSAATHMHEQSALQAATEDLHLQAAKQRLLNDYARRGITGFTDRRGRRWELSTYAEMVIRTAATEAALASTVKRYASSGIGLVHIPDKQRECRYCAPWEGTVLSISGPGGKSQQQFVVDGRTITVDVAGSLTQARMAGLLHPNCSHGPLPFVPGVTRLVKATADPQGYKDAQKLRALERRVRQAKRVEAVALTPAAKAQARDEIRHWQREVRAHVRATGQVRHVAREQHVPVHHVSSTGAS